MTKNLQKKKKVKKKKKKKIKENFILLNISQCKLVKFGGFINFFQVYACMFLLPLIILIFNENDVISRIQNIFGARTLYDHDLKIKAYTLSLCFSLGDNYQLFFSCLSGKFKGLASKERRFE